MDGSTRIPRVLWSSSLSLLGLAVALTLGCGSGSNHGGNPPGGDAGSDARSDGGFDGGLDAGSDGGSGEPPLEPAPDPSTVAPPLSNAVATPFAAANEFLFKGVPAVQTLVAPGAIDPARMAVIRGPVIGIDGVMYDRPHLERAKRLLARAKNF